MLNRALCRSAIRSSRAVTASRSTVPAGSRCRLPCRSRHVIQYTLPRRYTPRGRLLLVTAPNTSTSLPPSARRGCTCGGGPVAWVDVVRAPRRATIGARAYCRERGTPPAGQFDHDAAQRAGVGLHDEG